MRASRVVGGGQGAVVSVQHRVIFVFPVEIEERSTKIGGPTIHAPKGARGWDTCGPEENKAVLFGKDSRCFG